MYIYNYTLSVSSTKIPFLFFFLPQGFHSIGSFIFSNPLC